MAKDHQKDIDMSRMTSKIYVCNFRHQCWLLTIML
jgi:hypothetical protein